MQLLFAVTLFTSAALLFMVQPMFGKMVLPLLGGSPSVWNTCMVFYQATLLAGYIYAHVSTRWLGVRRQAALHMALLCIPWLALPLHVADTWILPAGSHPIPWLLMLMAVSVGLPFLVVSASAPMLQTWFANTGDKAAKDPYFLYAASNLGSMLGLLGYPLLVEPLLPLVKQSHLWSLGYGVLMLLTFACGVVLWKSYKQSPLPDPATKPIPQVESSARRKRKTRPDHDTKPTGETPLALLDKSSLALRLRWLLLSLVPSSLLLGVTAHIATDVAAVPLLWVIPLALYLLTFVLVFSRRQFVSHWLMVRLQPFLVLPLVVLFALPVMKFYPPLWFLLHLGAFFVTAMVCHGELARTRPDPRYLTEFYLWISIGGVLGGAFNALVAPVVFHDVIEYPIMIAVACLLRPPPDAEQQTQRAHVLDLVLPTLVLLVFGGMLFGMELFRIMTKPGFTFIVLTVAAIITFFFRRRALRFGLSVGAVFLVGALAFTQQSFVLHAERNFFGVLSVEQHRYLPVNVLMHGTTNHGMQHRHPELRLTPISYYTEEGPFGQIMKAATEIHEVREIGITGLGTGAASVYGRPGQRITYYEIDPATVRIARDPRYFTFLTDCQADLDIVLGDARLTLANAPDGHYDLLFLDAFSSDALPMHLVTREAVQLYLDKLAKHGLMAFNISNRFFDMAPVLGRLADDLGLTCRINRDEDVSKLQMFQGKVGSVWVVMTRSEENLGGLVTNPDWEKIEPDPGAPLWTDDYSNVVSALKWF